MSPQSHSTLLIVEDDPGLQKQLKWAFRSEYDVVIAGERKTALDTFDKINPSVVLHDLGLPPDDRGVEEGKRSIREILQRSSSTRVIVMTGQGGEQDAIELISLGAHDFLSKPVNLDNLKVIIDRAFYLSGIESSVSRATTGLEELFVLPGIVAQSKPMNAIAKVIKKVATTSASVFINGESGTGKELIAQAIHELSGRKSGPFVALNCAAIPENLLESELFGHEKGAFTGADKRGIGKIEQADGGTLFLDEIGDMAYPLQSKILRFLQERVLQRLGGKNEIEVDVRVVSATHQNLHELIKTSDFRQDLFYRINEIEIEVPPLRDRGEDVELLAKYFLDKFAQAHGKNKMSFSDSAMEAIKQFQWDGNIRQLSNNINKAVILSERNVVDHEDLDLGDASLSEDINFDDDTTIPTLKSAKEEAEYVVIRRALERNNNNVTLSAKKLGVSRQRIYDLIKKYGIH